MNLLHAAHVIHEEIRLGIETRDRLIADIRQGLADQRAMLEAHEKIAEQRIETIKTEFAEREANLRKLVDETVPAA